VAHSMFCSGAGRPGALPKSPHNTLCLHGCRIVLVKRPKMVPTVHKAKRSQQEQAAL